MNFLSNLSAKLKSSATTIKDTAQKTSGYLSSLAAKQQAEKAKQAAFPTASIATMPKVSPLVSQALSAPSIASKPVPISDAQKVNIVRSLTAKIDANQGMEKNRLILERAKIAKDFGIESYGLNQITKQNIPIPDKPFSFSEAINNTETMKALWKDVEESKKLSADMKDKYGFLGVLGANLYSSTKGAANASLGSAKTIARESLNLATGAGVALVDYPSDAVSHLVNIFLPKSIELPTNRVEKTREFNAKLQEYLQPKAGAESLGGVGAGLFFWSKIAVAGEKFVAENIIGKPYAALTALERQSAAAVSDGAFFTAIAGVQELAQEDPSVKNWLTNSVLNVAMGQAGEFLLGTIPKKLFGGDKELEKEFVKKLSKVAEEMRANGNTPQEIQSFFLERRMPSFKKDENDSFFEKSITSQKSPLTGTPSPTGAAQYKEGETITKAKIDELNQASGDGDYFPEMIKGDREIVSVPADQVEIALLKDGRDKIVQSKYDFYNKMAYDEIPPAIGVLKDGKVKIANGTHRAQVMIDKGQPVKVVLREETQKATKSVSEAEGALMEEAKKYKSAEEFVKAQGKTVYHGSPNKIIGGLKSSKELGTSQHTSNFGGVFFSEDKFVADAYSKLPNRTNLSKIKRPEVSNYIDRLQNKITEYNNTVDELYQGFNKSGWIVDNDFERYISAERGGKPIRDKIAKIQNEIRDIKKTAPDLTDTEKKLLYGNANTQEVVLIGDVVDINKRVGFSENREALIEKYKGKIIKLKDGNNQVEYIATDPSQIKTKSQLIDIWNKSQPLQEGVNPLIQEARKYKSAEEFIKSQGTPVYHGTSAENAKGIFNNGFALGKGKGVSGTASNDFIYVTPSKTGANKYVSDRLGIKEPTVIESTISGKTLVIPGNNWDFEAFGEASKRFGVPLKPDSRGNLTMLDMPAIKSAMEEQGFGSIAFKDRGANGSQAVAVLPGNIKTRTQLEDIWNQANKPELLKTPQKSGKIGGMKTNTIEEQAAEAVRKGMSEEESQNTMFGDETLGIGAQEGLFEQAPVQRATIITRPDIFQSSREGERLSGLLTESGAERSRVDILMKGGFREDLLIKNPIEIGVFSRDIPEYGIKKGDQLVISGHNRFEIFKRSEKEERPEFFRKKEYDNIDDAIADSIKSNVGDEGASTYSHNIINLLREGKIQEKNLPQILNGDASAVRQIEKTKKLFDNFDNEFWREQLVKLAILKRTSESIIQRKMSAFERLFDAIKKFPKLLEDEVYKKKISQQIDEISRAENDASLKTIAARIERINSAKNSEIARKQIQNLFGEKEEIEIINPIARKTKVLLNKWGRLARELKGDSDAETFQKAKTSLEKGDTNEAQKDFLRKVKQNGNIRKIAEDFLFLKDNGSTGRSGKSGEKTLRKSERQPKKTQGNDKTNGGNAKTPQYNADAGLTKKEPEAPKTPPKKGEKISESRVKINKQLPEESRVKETYKTKTNKGEIDAAINILKEDSAKAMGIVEGKEPVGATTLPAMAAVMMEKARDEKNFAFLGKLYGKAAENITETAQALQSVSILHEKNPEFRYVRDVINARLSQYRMGEPKARAEIMEKKTERVKREVAPDKKKLRSKAFKDFLTSFTC